MASCICFSALLANAGNQQKKPPHIILIMTDQQRGDALGCAEYRSFGC